MRRSSKIRNCRHKVTEVLIRSLPALISPRLRSRSPPQVTAFLFIDNMERGLISVDRWSEGSQVYFLTHLHADHTNGLSATWSKGPIFCSRLTAKLFPFKFPAFNLSLLRILEIGSWHSVSLVSPTTRLQTVVHVMAIDANHCPVMYLFRGEFGCMLCTGDFRWESTSERALIGRAMLVKALNGDKVDILYLDNTYCNPSYSFPSREVAAQQSFYFKLLGRT